MNAALSALTRMGIEPRGETAAPSSPPGGRTAVTPTERIGAVDLSYDGIITMMLLSPPGETHAALARKIGYSQSWLSRLLASDAFQVRLAERIEKDVAPERREVFRLRFASIEEEARGILMESLQKLSARLQDPAGVPDQLLIKTTEVTSRLLGYGARSESPAPPVHMHVHLEQLANNLRTLNQAPVATDAEIVPAPDVGGMAGKTGVSS